MGDYFRLLIILENFPESFVAHLMRERLYVYDLFAHTLCRRFKILELSYRTLPWHDSVALEWSFILYSVYIMILWPNVSIDICPYNAGKQ